MATQKGACGLNTLVDRDAPSLFRIYDYLLSGGHNLAADRLVADKIAALVPECGVPSLGPTSPRILGATSRF
ncbi:SAM-dependent methyltransferase [Prauserella flavalba]|uniref:Uncharacterized protein n=1 Tax=Prauserella flavalba TaxID=1477506 RepID=A0A318LXV4_9PSEU|nr:SAM-dependent methyltransferase [Prauserella flavalba]PXY17728.1 hypothetical protein BA062_36855 [Prauserella flavalba]PXY18632.1 hypothetical protein BAY59_33705 [Prauserella coralliicola]